MEPQRHPIKKVKILCLALALIIVGAACGWFSARRYYIRCMTDAELLAEINRHVGQVELLAHELSKRKAPVTLTGAHRDPLGDFGLPVQPQR
jgi:hypothetical protein